MTTVETVELLLLAEEEVVLEDGDPDVIEHEKLFHFFFTKIFHLEWRRTTLGSHGSSQSTADEWHLFMLSLITKFTGDCSLQLRTCFMQSPESGLKRMSLLGDGSCAHVIIVFLLLEPSEVVLDEECGVELANCHLLLEN